MDKILVAYFSASGNTKKIAEKIAKIADADIYEIKPASPYTSADLDWTDKKSRSTLEMSDHNSRPAIVKDDLPINRYQTLFLGFPIWWYIAPTIINSFLESYDFSNKRIILFATSGGSGFGETVKHLKPSVADSTNIIAGKILNKDLDNEQIKQWLDELPPL